jgi:integrase
MLWMKKNAYEDTTIKATAKRLKHLQKNCLLADPESAKLYVANKKCSNAFKESLVQAYGILMRKIGLYDFRHFKATMEYHKTKDLLHVKAILGHKDLRTTLRYTQLLETIETDDNHCKTATSIKEATDLIENGFEYVTEMEGTKLFRKRK